MKGLSKGRYDETFAGEDGKGLALYYFKQLTIDLLILSCSND